MTIFRFPRADFTDPIGINSLGQVVGTYWNPLEPGRSGLFRAHGFLWSNGVFTTIDFLIPGVNTFTQLYGIDGSGRIIGSYFTFTPDNETQPGHAFIYDKGIFSIIQAPGAAPMGDANGRFVRPAPASESLTRCVTHSFRSG